MRRLGTAATRRFNPVYDRPFSNLTGLLLIELSGWPYHEFRLSNSGGTRMSFKNLVRGGVAAAAFGFLLTFSPVDAVAGELAAISDVSSDGGAVTALEFSSEDTSRGLGDSASAGLASEDAGAEKGSESLLGVDGTDSADDILGASQDGTAGHEVKTAEADDSAQSDGGVVEGDSGDFEQLPSEEQGSAESEGANDEESEVSDSNLVETNEAQPESTTNAIEDPSEDLKDGSYSISTSLDKKKVLDVPGGSVSNGNKLQIYSSNGTDAQVWRISTDASGYTTIYSGDSSKVLDVANGYAYSGATVQLYEYNGSLAQKWILTAYDAFYKITSALNHLLVLDLSSANTTNGTKLQLWKDNGTSAQRWYFTGASTKRQRIDEVANDNISALEDGTYAFSTLLGGDKVIDVSGGSTANGTTIQLWASNKTDAQVWTVSHDSKGYVTLTHTASGKVLDVAGAKASAGARIQLYASNGTNAQKWIAVKNDDGSVKFLSALDSTLAIDIKYGSVANGASIWLYDENGTRAQAWTYGAAQTKRMRLDALAKENAEVLADGTYGVRSDLSLKLVIDVSGGSTANGGKVQTYSPNDSKAQQWLVVHDTTGYVTFINVGSSKALDVAGGVAKSGTTVQQYALNGTWAQKWIVVADGDAYKILSALAENLVLDVPAASLNKGARIQLYTDNGTTAQRWTFSRVSDEKVTVTASYVKGAIQAVDIGFGDKAFCMPSAALDGSAELTFDSDVYVGASRQLVTKGQKVKVSDILGSGLSCSEAFSVFNGVGKEVANVYLMFSQNVASLFIQSDDPEQYGRAWVESSSDHTNATSGNLYMYDADGSVVYGGALSQIKGRGNSSWYNAVKKPYQIKLSKKTDLLETGDKSNKAKTWVLLTDNFDPSSSRNAIAYTLASLLGCSSPVEYRNIDLYYDGEYRGSYLLCEKVQINSGRVDIQDLEADTEDLNPNYEDTEIVEGKNSYGMTIRYGKGLTSPEDITGGYLIELEESSSRYNTESAFFMVKDGNSTRVFVCKSPEIWSYDEANYFSCLIQDIFDALNNGGVVPAWRGSLRAGKKTSELVDFDSLARLYWLNEIMKNQDGFRYSSTYIYKDSDDGDSSKLTFGPAWDFDLSCGNDQYCPPSGVLSATDWWTRANGICTTLFKDTSVRKAVESCKSDVIKTFRSYLSGGALQEQMEDISASVKMNAFVWGEKSETWNDVRDWLNKRLDWIEKN